MAEQSNSTTTAAAADQYGTMLAKTCAYPHNAEALNVAIAACDFDVLGKEAQASDVRVLEAYIRLIDLAVIARDDVAQFANINIFQQLDCRPWLGMLKPATICFRQLRRHHFSNPGFTLLAILGLSQPVPFSVR